MKVKTLSALAGLGTAMIMSTAANAAFLNITIQNENSFFDNHANLTVRNAWLALGGSVDVYRIYANFDALGGDNRVNTIFGSDTDNRTAWMTQHSGGNFINTIDSDHHGTTHYDTPPSGAVFNSSPQRAWETYMGVGAFVGGSEIIQGPNNHDPSEANHFQASWASQNFAYTITPDNVQGNAAAPGPNQSGLPDGAAGRVFLMQVAVAAGTHISGQFGLNVGAPGFVTSDVYGDTTFFTTIPAPGALALLGLAGLVGGRRRRA